jgi:hypothetical protein
MSLAIYDDKMTSHARAVEEPSIFPTKQDTQPVPDLQNFSEEFSSHENYLPNFETNTRTALFEVFTILLEGIQK